MRFVIVLINEHDDDDNDDDDDDDDDDHSIHSKLKIYLFKKSFVQSASIGLPSRTRWDVKLY